MCVCVRACVCMCVCALGRVACTDATTMWGDMDTLAAGAGMQDSILHVIDDQ